MKWKKRVSRALSVALTAALVVTINIPTIAWGAEGDAPGSPLSVTIKGSTSDAASQVDSFAAAFGVKAEGETNVQRVITLNQDITEDVVVPAEAETTTTIDLNGHKLSSDAKKTITVEGALVIQDSSVEGTGTIENTNASSDAAVFAQKGGSVALKSGSVKGAKRGIWLYGASLEMSGGSVAGVSTIGVQSSGTATTASSAQISGGTVVGGKQSVAVYGSQKADGSSYSSTVTISGSADIQSPNGAAAESTVCVFGAGAQLDMTGGTVAQSGANFYGISGNGLEKNFGTVINISGGVVNGGVYHPQVGTLTVTGGAIKGATGIEMRAGTLKVSDAAQIEGATDAFSKKANGDGGATSGAGIAVAQHTTKQAIDVAVSGGAISGYHAFYEGNPQQNSADDIAKVKLAISGGTFTASAEGKAVLSDDKTAFITGGTFNTDPTAYVADGLKATQGDNGWTIDSAAFAEMTIDEQTKTYTDPTAFFTALQSATNKTVGIKLLSDVSIDDTYIPIAAGQTVTLDFNGYTLKKASGADPVIDNAGELSLLDGVGTEGGIQGYRSCVRNAGTLVVEGGRYRTSDTAGGSAILNSASGRATINKCAIEASMFAFGNLGTAVVNGGTFANESCSGCSSNWAYTVNSQGGTIEFNGGEVQGVQGALAVSGGKGVVNGGTFTAHACKTHGAAKAFYALYVAGEAEAAQCTVNDGAFVSEGAYAVVLVGNDNKGGDGGINAEATSWIKGGTFTATLSTTPALKGAPETGNPSVSGGVFSSAVDAAYCAEGFVPVKIEEGKFGVAPAQAACGETKYASLQEALDAAQAGDTVMLLADCAADVTLPANKNLTLNGNGYTISGKLGGTNVGDVTVKGATFTVAPDVSLAAGKKITFSSCTFDKANGTAKKNPSVTVHNGNPAFKNCSFVSATEGDQTVGIQTWDAATAEVSGCTFTGFTGTPITLSTTTGNVTVTNNVIEGWGTAAGAGDLFAGRAMRLDLDGAAAGTKVVVTGNKMVKEGFDSTKNESFVKLSGDNLAKNDITVTNNYWNGLDPNTAKAIADGEAGTATEVSIMQFTKAGETLALYPYFTDAAMTTLATGENVTKTEEEVVTEKLADVSSADKAKEAADTLASATQATKDALAQDDTAKQQIAAAETTLTSDSTSKVAATAVEGDASTGAEVTGAALTAAATGSADEVKALVTIEQAPLPADKVLPGNVENALSLDITMDVVKTDGSLVASDVQPAAPITLKVKIPSTITDSSKLVIYHFHGTAAEPEVFSVEKGNLVISEANGEKFATLTLSKLSYLVLAQSAASTLCDDISTYRSGDASTWTYPTAAPGTAFAGWYTDQTLTTPLGKNVTTGAAYAKFVNVSDIITFKGGSLRMDTTPETQESMRFGYSLYLPTGTQLKGAGWNYQVEGESSPRLKEASNFAVYDNGSMDVNLVITDIPKANYGTNIAPTMYVSYTTADNTTVRFDDTAARTRSVNMVATFIRDSSTAPAAEKEYAGKILA